MKPSFFLGLAVCQLALAVFGLAIGNYWLVLVALTGAVLETVRRPQTRRHAWQRDAAGSSG
jgi:hypothetical protein